MSVAHVYKSIALACICIHLLIDCLISLLVKLLVD